MGAKEACYVAVKMDTFIAQFIELKSKQLERSVLYHCVMGPSHPYHIAISFGN